MTKKSLDFELKVVDGLRNLLPNSSIIHTGNNSQTSDINLIYNGYSTFIEAKISGGQFGCPRLKYIDNIWTGVTENPISNSVSYILNNDPHAYSFMEYSKTLYQYKQYKHIMPSYSVFQQEPDEYFNYNSLSDIIKNVGNQYIYKSRENTQLLNIIVEYYTLKKVDYIQISDNFYQINKNSLTDIPNITADVELTVRLVNRRTKKWFEVIPTLKLKNMVESNFSILLNTKKLNPFKNI